MKYIKTLEINNFQSHKNSSINFENGLNVISGPSDNGKSAIIRALKWVLYNEPKGTDFIRQGETGCKVSISLSDGTIITRERTKSKNQYKIYSSDNEEQVFEGFGNEIPEEVLRAHGITRLFIDNTSAQSVNLSEQLEGPFLLSQPGSTKAKAIGRLVGVHIVDEAVKDVSKDLAALNSEERNINNNIEYIVEKLKDFNCLYKIKDEIDRKEKLIELLKSKNERLKKLKASRIALQENKCELITVNNLLYSLKDIKLAEDMVMSLVTKYRIQNTLINTRAKYGQIIKENFDLVNVIEKTKNVDLAATTLSYLVEITFRREKLISHYSKLHTCLKGINDMEYVVFKLSNVEEAQDIFKKLDRNIAMLLKYKEAGENLKLACERIKKGEEYIKNFSEIDFAQEYINLCVQRIDRLSRIMILKDRIIDSNSQIEGESREIGQLSETISMCIKDYMVLLKKIGKCPVCMSPIEEHTVEHIINEFRGDVKNE